VLVFPIVWATLAKQQQINLAKPIIALLSKEYHQRQAMARPNVVQVSVGCAAGRQSLVHCSITTDQWGEWEPAWRPSKSCLS
jgi:hypothetical protein